MFGQTTVGAKLMTAVGTVVLCTLVLGGFGIYSVMTISGALEEAIAVDARQLEQVNAMRSHAWEAETQKRGAFLVATLGKMELIKGFESRFGVAMGNLRERIVEIERLPLGDADRASLGEMKAVANEYEPLVRQFLGFVNAGRANEVGPLVEKIVPLVDRFDQIGTAMAGRGSERLAATRGRAATLQTSSMWLTVGMLLFATLASTIAVVVIRSVVSNLRGITTELAHGSEEVASAAGQVSSSAQSMSQAANEQAASIEETSASSEELNSMTQKNAENSKQAARGMDDAGRLITETNQHLDSMLGSMKAINESSEKISKIIKVIDEIAFQTNILALNAAVEAARAGEAGMGFAVVADEVRTLAETSEKSARDIQDLVGQIQAEVKVIAEGINTSATAAQQEAENGRTVAQQIDRIRGDMTIILTGASEIRSSAEEAQAAAGEAQKGSETISAAAQEQSAACEEAVKTVEQQTTALAQSEGAASELSELSDDLKNSTDIGKSAEEVASAAEELSAAVEEINRAAAEIMTAIEQINRGAQQQSAATQQSSAALAQIERSAQVSSQRAAIALEKGQEMTARLGDNAAAVERMITGVEQSVRDNDAAREQINALEQVSRRIDKIVDAITTVSIQTSMLAVNGSIEAARAGEFGKGFMVVSTDIRNLARDSAENAERIKDLVKGVQDQIVAVRRDLEETAALAKAEMEKNRTITVNLASVTTDMALVLDGNRSIANDATSILASTEELKRGVEQVAAAAAQASQAAQQATQAAREQAKGAEELASAVEEIASLADELQTTETP